MSSSPDHQATGDNRRPPIPIPDGGFRTNEDDARWLEQTLIMRMNETLQAAGINAKWHANGLYDLLLLSLNAASRRSDKSHV